jgi:excisionase family DNA binding protein
MESMEPSETEPQPQTYKIEDVAKILGIGRNQAYEAVRRGDLPSITIGSRQRVPRPALEKLLGGKLP